MQHCQSFRDSVITWCRADVKYADTWILNVFQATRPQCCFACCLHYSPVLIYSDSAIIRNHTHIIMNYVNIHSYLVIPVLTRRSLSVRTPVWVPRLSVHRSSRGRVSLQHPVLPVHGPLWQILDCAVWQNSLSGPNVLPAIPSSSAGVPGPVARARPVGRNHSIAIIFTLQAHWHPVWSVAEVLVLDGVRQAGVVEATCEERAIRQPVGPSSRSCQQQTCCTTLIENLLWNCFW